MKYWLIIIVVLLGVGLYFFIDPSVSVLMPKCPLRLLTGVDCPACGIQRAAHHFLNGEFLEALRYNYFLVISIPYLIAVALTTFIKTEKLLKAREYVQHPKVVMTFFGLTIAWWVIRNIPYCQEQFCMLF